MTDMQEFVINLSKGYSTQAKTTNSFWIVLIISSIIALVGRVDEKNLIELPFTLGKVIPVDFYAISIVLISIVTIVFSAAMTQTLRTRMLVQCAIEQLNENERQIGKVDFQDFFDSMVTPTYTRIAPISQFMLGKRQFFGDGNQNKYIKALATFLYVILKLTTFVFLYFIPVFVLNKCWKNLHIYTSGATIHIPDLILLALMILAGICMLIMFIGDIKHIYRVCIKLLR